MALRKILAIKLRSLGDTVLLTASLEELWRAFPGAEIHAAVTSSWASILEGHPAIQRIWSYERHREPAARAKAIARFAFKLRKEHFDCVINFHASPSSAIISFATGAKTRSIHFHGHRAKNRYSTVVVPGKGILKPIIERDMDSVRALGVSIKAGKLPRVYLAEPELSSAAEEIRRSGLHRPLLGIGLGASRPAKSWSVEKFAGLASRWIAETHGSVLVVAGPGEKDSIERLSRQLGSQGVYYLFNPPLRTLAALLAQVSVFAGNDSGPKHLAIATGVPTVTFFGPEHPFEWHPYARNEHPFFFIEPLACRKDAQPGMPAWCGIHECILEKHRCMSQIEVDPVLLECKRVARS